MIIDGLKDCSSTVGVAEEPMILAGNDCTFKRRQRQLLLPPPRTLPESRPPATPPRSLTPHKEAGRQHDSGRRSGTATVMERVRVSTRVRGMGVARFE